MNKPASSSVFFKYLLSYTIIFILPVLSLGIVLLNASVSILRNQVDEYSYDMLNSAQQSIDSRLEELNHIAMQISNIPDLRGVRYSQDFFSIRNAISNIHNITVINNFIHQTFLYYKGQNLIYGSAGTYRLEHFLNLIYRYEHWNHNNFLDDIENLNEIKVRPAETISIYGDFNPNERYLTYIVPIPYGNSTPDGVVFFTIQEKVFENLFLQVLHSPNSLIFVLDNHNQPLITYADTESVNLGIQYLLNNGNRFYSKKAFWNGIEYSVSAIQSKTTGWTYMVAIPVHEVAEKMQPVTSMAIIVFVAVVLVGIVAIIVLTRINYKPISELTLSALKGLDYKFENNFNEIETVKQAVSHMNHMINTLQQKVEHTVPIMKKTFLTRLIKGYYQDLDSANSDASELGITIPQASYCAAACLISSGNDDKTSDLMGIIESLSTDDIAIYALDGLDQNYITLLFINKDAANSNFDTSVSSLINSLKHAMSINMTVGVGKWVRSVNEIGNSYMQASTALDYRFVKGRNTITFYSELENSVQNLDYNPKEQLDLLEMRILHGNIEETRAILSSIFDDIKSRQFPIFYVRTFCYNIINSVLNSLYKMEKELNLREYQYLDIIALIDSQTIDELHQKTQDMCLSICTAVYKHSSESNAERIKKMIDYIHLHYSSADFSVQNMASEFNMSTSGLSSYFKSQTSENISDYVNSLRIAKAKKLLEETDFTLQEIVQRVGYINVSSFIRKFKQYTKVTPGVYRELIK